MRYFRYVTGSGAKTSLSPPGGTGVTTPDRSIRLAHPRGATTIAAENVYFPFASGRLHYDCITCNAKCCRGFGYVSTVGPELQGQIKMRPSLPLFLESMADGNARQYVVGNCAPGCFFLSPGGRCEIQLRHGYDAKPETCRLFPFNDFRRVGQYLLVAPHPFLCPLEVAPPDRTSACSSHDALIEAMSRGGIAARVHECKQDRAAPDVVAFERQIVALSETFLCRGNYPEFVRAQLHAQAAFERLQDANLPNVDAMLDLVAELVGVPKTVALGEDIELVRTNIAMTPLLRSQLIFFDESQSSGLPLEHRRIPLAILCVYLFAEAARASGMKHVTFQTVSKLAHDFRALAHILAYSDAVMVWQRGATIDVSRYEPAADRSAFLRLSKALLPVVQRKRQARLGDLLRDCAPADSFARVMFLKQAAKHLAGNIVLLKDESRTVRGNGLRQRSINAVRRWALANLDERVLRSAYGADAAPTLPFHAVP